MWRAQPWNTASEHLHLDVSSHSSSTRLRVHWDLSHLLKTVLHFSKWH
jgi:hypothetical protein